MIRRQVASPASRSSAPHSAATPPWRLPFVRTFLVLILCTTALPGTSGMMKKLRGLGGGSVLSKEEPESHSSTSHTPAPCLEPGKRLGSGSFGTVYIAKADKNMVIKKFTDQDEYEAERAAGLLALKFVHGDGGGGGALSRRKHLLAPMAPSGSSEWFCNADKMIYFPKLPGTELEYLQTKFGHNFADVHKLVDIVLDLVATVVAMHKADLVHMDIKPNNVFFNVGMLPSGVVGPITTLIDIGMLMRISSPQKPGPLCVLYPTPGGYHGLKTSFDDIHRIGQSVVALVTNLSPADAKLRELKELHPGTRQVANMQRSFLGTDGNLINIGAHEGWPDDLKSEWEGFFNKAVAHESDAKKKTTIQNFQRVVETYLMSPERDPSNYDTAVETAARQLVALAREAYVANGNSAVSPADWMNLVDRMISPSEDVLQLGAHHHGVPAELFAPMSQSNNNPGTVRPRSGEYEAGGGVLDELGSDSTDRYARSPSDRYARSPPDRYERTPPDDVYAPPPKDIRPELESPKKREVLDLGTTQKDD